jgi:antitoxin PrlF
MSKSKVNSKGQITIPVEIRNELQIKPGDSIDFFRTIHGDYLIQRNSGSIMDLKGILKRTGYVVEGRTVTLKEMDEAIAEHACEMDRRSLSDYFEDDSAR